MVSTVARPTSGDSSAGTHWHRSGRGGDDLSELSIFSMEKKKRTSAKFWHLSTRVFFLSELPCPIAVDTSQLEERALARAGSPSCGEAPDSGRHGPKEGSSISQACLFRFAAGCLSRFIKSPMSTVPGYLGMRGWSGWLRWLGSESWY